MSEPRGRFVPLLVSLLVISSASLGISVYALVLSPVSVAPGPSRETESPEQTVTVIGQGSVEGQFDQAVVVVGFLSVNETVAAALDTIQAGTARVAAALRSAGLADIKLTMGSARIVSSFESGPTSNRTLRLTVAQQVSAVVTSPDADSLLSLASRVMDVLQSEATRDGLQLSTGVYEGGPQIFLQLSEARAGRLTAEALREGVANARLRAEELATAQGLEILDILKVTQTSSYYPGFQACGPYSAYCILQLDITVEVTFLVRRA